MKYVGILLLLLMTTGFRIFTGGNQWPISKDDPKLFLKFCEPMVPTENDVAEGDDLHGTTLTHNAVVDSILNDYNQINGSYLELADSDRDGDFNSTTHASRIIEICFGSQQTNFEGYAKLKYNDDFTKFAGCTITLSSKTLSSAKRFIRTVTHEVGHCLALTHPQETQHAVMSYFSGKNIYRLQSDDKAGILSLYPENKSDLEAIASFGMACSPR